MRIEFAGYDEQQGLLDDNVVARLVKPLMLLYWLAMFAGTHWPRAPQVGLGITDKALHFAAFCGLAFLLSAARSISRTMTLGTYACIFGVLAVYGALDEISQIPVGRDCEWLDFRADLVGTAVGLAVFALAHLLARAAYAGVATKESRVEA